MNEQWRAFLLVSAVSAITGVVFSVIAYFAPEGGYSMAVDIAFVWMASGVAVGYVFGKQSTPSREIILVMVGTVSPVILGMMLIDVILGISRKVLSKLKVTQSKL